MARMRRGSVPVEYVLVVAGVAAIGMLGVVIPRGLGDMMMGGAEQMEVGGTGTDGNLSPFGQPASSGPGTPADDGVASPFEAPVGSEGWADDPWARPSPEPKKTGSGCNQGKGNGAEGCDPGNSNQGDPTRSNDEPGGTTRGRGR